jgi:hypothetical protein
MPDAALGSVRLMFPSLVYYAGRPVEILDTPGLAGTFFTTRAGAFAIMDRPTFDALRAELPQVCVAATRPRLDAISLRDVIAGRPPGDVLLVTNACAAPTN